MKTKIVDDIKEHTKMRLPTDRSFKFRIKKGTTSTIVQTDKYKFDAYLQEQIALWLLNYGPKHRERGMQTEERLSPQELVRRDTLIQNYYAKF